ncbi:RloB family protein [Vibrio harveyi]|uniref:RloB family protein n=1 Tax=Vibrio harveyi TaxID=669 RepID=UPI00215C7848|nr:RloB family protein [Vibrio harveyi]MCR9769964.1 RloB family protein [Vibrio harveyi]
MFERPTKEKKDSSKRIEPITCYVICEGYVDESKYFKAIESKIKNRYKGNLVFIPIERQTTNSAPKKVCEELKDFIESKKLRFKKGTDDYAFMIIDRDHHFNGGHLRGTTEALDYCNEQNVDVLVNVPSFEVWEICHFKNLADESEEYLTELFDNKRQTRNGKPFAKKEVSRLVNGADYNDIVLNLVTALENEHKLRVKYPCSQVPPSQVQSNVGTLFKLFEEKGYEIESMFL